MESKRKSIISCAFDGLNTLTFGVEGVGNMTLDVAAVSGEAWSSMTETGRTALLHGYEQKVRDAAAIPRDTSTGKSASPREKHDEMLAVVKNLQSGVWSAKRSAVQALNRAALFESIAEVRNVEASLVEAKFRDRPDEVLRAFLTHKDIAAAYAARTTRGDQSQAEALLEELE